mmetsp:Transcript_1625/g.4574  ORF Transcript_1625/g.4574 Transcript_1625/m.4574 type:complete len:209 (-) Transcript_1625:115-741(-)
MEIACLPCDHLRASPGRWIWDATRRRHLHSLAYRHLPPSSKADPLNQAWYGVRSIWATWYLRQRSVLWRPGPLHSRADHRRLRHLRHAYDSLRCSSSLSFLSHSFLRHGRAACAARRGARREGHRFVKLLLRHPLLVRWEALRFRRALRVGRCICCRVGSLTACTMLRRRSGISSIIISSSTWSAALDCDLLSGAGADLCGHTGRSHM